MQRRANQYIHTSVRFTVGLKDKIEQESEILNIPTAEWIRRACEEKIERDEQKRRGLAEQKQMYIDSKLIDAIKYALTLPEVQQMIKDMLWKKNE